ncbi:MAG: hypothetical protein WCT27_02840 [Patescibacteria group bacterium]|jgi:hypothetical protein
MAYIETQIEVAQQVKTTTKITLAIGMITAGFVGISLFANAFLAGPIGRSLPATDTNPPTVRLQTPLAHNVSGIRLLSVSLMDYSSINHATVLIDGKASYRENNPKSQWLYFLNSHTLAAGKHTIAFLATDSEGNRSVSEPILFIVSN